MRTDCQTPGRPSLKRQPILLARLPLVGESVAFVESEPPLAIVNEEPVFESPAHEGPTISHFVDSGHVQQPEVAPTPSHKKQTRQSKTLTRQSSKSPQPTRLATILCHFHTQTKPFAGAIVALALVTAISLMYWVLLSPSLPSADLQEVLNDDWNAPSAEMPMFTPQTTSTQISETTSLATPPDEEMQSPTEPSAVALQTIQAAPEEASPVLKAPELATAPEASAPEEKSVEVYPSTTRTWALDFSQVSAAGEGGLLEPTATPTVAHRPIEQTTAPARR